jgi:hypothetical protein
MLRAKYLLVNRQRAFVEWPCGSEVALAPTQESEVAQACRRVRMLGAERLLSQCQCVGEKRRSLGVSRTLMQIAACSIQESRKETVIRILITAGGEMRCKLGAKRPQLGIPEINGIDRY